MFKSHCKDEWMGQKGYPGLMQLRTILHEVTRLKDAPHNKLRGNPEVTTPVIKKLGPIFITVVTNGKHEQSDFILTIKTYLFVEVRVFNSIFPRLHWIVGRASFPILLPFLLFSASFLFVSTR